MKVISIFGTRPEAIKMAPLVKELELEPEINHKVCITAQHREMLDQVLKAFDIKPQYDLNLMKANQTLSDITSRVLLGLQPILMKEKPDIILVHGDTTTTLSASLAAFYQKIAVGHVEAGLRTGNLYSPWPEEANRKLTSQITKFHFAPSELNKKNLLNENVLEEKIFITGNTVIDALLLTRDQIKQNTEKREKLLSFISSSGYSITGIKSDRPYILVTGHRRENFGEGFLNICEALKVIANQNPHIDIVYPVHLNPQVQKPVLNILSKTSNIYLIQPLEYESFIALMMYCYFIITDSGGIQEEAPSLGKPVLVMRDTTERPEALNSGTVKLVGANKDNISKTAQELIDQPKLFEKMSQAINPYGDGLASKRIVKIIKDQI